MKFLVVGLGSMGKRRIRNLQYLKAGTVYGFDLRADRRAEAEQKYGVRTFANLADAMAMNPDALVISTPPDLHAEYALAAARAGKHFFTEAGVEPDNIEEIIAAARTSGVVAAPSCTMRFHPSIRKVKELVDSGEVGRVLTFTYHCGQYLPDWHPWEDYRKFYVARKKTGACREIVPFELTWLTWLFGGVAALSAMRSKLTQLETDIDDAYHLLLRFQSGQLGNTLVDVISRVPYRQLKLLSEEAVLTWDWTSKTVRVFKPGMGWQEYQEPVGIQEDGYVTTENMYIDEMSHFVGAIRGEHEWMHSLEADWTVLKLLQASERSSDEGTTVRF